MNTLFKALNDPTRRQMLDLLRERDLTAGEIADRFDMTKPSISHHLDLLRQAGLVESVKQGQFITYSLNTTVLDELLAWLMNLNPATQPKPANKETTPSLLTDKPVYTDEKNPIYSEPVMIALLCLPFVYLAFIWNQLPATIPGHYGPGGHPDRYDPKELLAAVWVVISVLIYAMRLLPRFDPKGNLFGANFTKIRFLIIIFWAGFVSWFWHISLHGIAPGSLITNVLIGANLMLAGIGNLMYTLKPSFFVGIRTPWTLSNDTVWRKTHHLAGWLWVAGGLVGALLVWLLPITAKLPVFMSIIWVLVLIPVGYSYVIYRKLETASTQKSN